MPPPKKLKPKVPPASPKRMKPKIKSASPKSMKPKEQYINGLLSGPQGSLAASMTVKPKKTVEIPIRLRTH